MIFISGVISIIMQKKTLQKQSSGGVLKNFAKFTGKHLCQSLIFKKETLAQVFSCEFCEISKKTFFHKTPLVAASDFMYK